LEATLNRIKKIGFFLCFLAACADTTTPEDTNNTSQDVFSVPDQRIVPQEDLRRTPPQDSNTVPPDVPITVEDLTNVDDTSDTVTNPPQDVPPIQKVTGRYIRVVTELSPSWVSWFEVVIEGAPVGTNSIPSNVALGATVSASSSGSDGPVSHLIDNDLSTSWNSGDFPPAHIEIDLGQTMELTEIRLLVGQQPAGVTKHVIQLKGANGSYEPVHTFAQHTQNGDWLVYQFEVNTSPTPTDPIHPRGIDWVRNNPMFVSGLAVSSGAPSSSAAADYFNGFNANAVHLWANGLPTELGGWQNASPEPIRWVSWVDDYGKSVENNQVIGGLSANPPGRIGYQVGDEPGMHGNGLAELMELEIGVNAVRAQDPDALIIINFTFWADEIDPMLDYFGSTMDADVFSYDRYAMDYKEHETLKLIRDAGIKWNKPYWRYLRSYHENNEGKRDYTEIDYRWHAFVGLVYGYTGHTWFVYMAAAPHTVVSEFFPNQSGYNQNKESQWYWMAQINVEMNNLGRAITQLTSTAVRYLPGQSIYLPDGLVAWSPGAGGDPYITNIEVPAAGLSNVVDLAMGFFVDDSGEHYVMIQNQQHPNASWPIDNTKSITYRVTFDFSSAPAGFDKTKLTYLDRLTGTLMELPLVTNPDGTAVLDHTLEAGDPILFKYSSGAPFALGPE